MKQILFFFFLIFLPLGKAMAASPPLVTESIKQAPTAPHLKPIKVSEINANLFSAIYDFFKGMGHDLFEGFVSLKDFVETGQWLITNINAPETRYEIASFSLRLMVVFFVSFVFAQALAAWLRPKIHQLLHCQEAPSLEKFKNLLGAVLLSTFAPLLFGFFLYTLSRLITPPEEVYLEIARILSSGTVIIWIFLNITHLFLRPLTPEHQHLPLSHEALATSYKWIRRIAIVALFGYFALETGALISLPASGERLLLQGTGFVIALMAILMMLALHQEVADWIERQRNTLHLSKSKQILLPYLKYSYLPVIVFIVICYVSWVTEDHEGIQLTIWKTLLTLAFIPLLHVASTCLRKIRVLYVYKNLQSISHSLADRVVFYGSQIDFVMVVLLNIAVLLFILDLWGLNPSYFLFSKTGKVIAEKSFSIFTIIVAALVITRAGNGLLTHYLSATKESLRDTQKQKIARFKTIHSVSRNILRIAVWTPAILLIIVELEVDIVPILATVGILSLGISIGFQSLVKDLVTGFFMLLEDAFAVGDLVVINGQMGRIESLTVRVVRVRATDGSLHTFPYGNITSLCNQNRDFSAAVMLFRVGIEANIDQVFDMIEKISKDLRKDPSTRRLIAGPVEIDGVSEVSDYALEIRAVLKTKPGEYFKVRYAFNRLLKQYLEAENIPPAIPREISHNYAFEK